MMRSLWTTVFSLLVIVKYCDNSLSRHHLNDILTQHWLVEAGLSLNHTRVQDIKTAARYRSGAGVRAIISLNNWSMFTLLDVETNTECGTTNSEFPPRNVFPGYREVMVMENTNPMMGTCGTISWQLVEINMRLIIMWSVPFNFNIRDSYYAIGLTHNKGKFPNSAYWFNQMYYGTNSAFRRSGAGRGLVFSSNILNIKGFMEGNTYHSILNISVTPARLYHLAESIQKKLISTQLPPSMIRSGAEGIQSPVILLLTLAKLKLHYSG